MRGRNTSDGDYLTGIPAGRRRSRFRAASRRFGTRHPLIALTIGLVVMAGLGIAEVLRVADARRTVGHGWALGVLGGVAVAGAMYGLLVVAYRAGRAARRLGPFSVLILVVTVSFGVILRSSAPPSDQVGPYVVTTPLETGELAYLSVICAAIVGIIVFAAVRIIRLRRGSVPGRGPGQPRAS
jgi:hypothetical protein